MKQADDAALIGTIIASAAAASYVRTIPDEQETAGDGSASLTLGYPPETFLSPTAGGKYTDGRDFNGFLNLLSRAIQRLQAGFFGQFNADFAEKIGGYPLGAVVSGDSAGTFWVSTADGNTSAPGGGSTTWISLFNGYALSSWVSGNFVNGTAAGQNGGVQNIQISNYASGLGGASTYLQVTPPGASSFAIPSVGYGNNIWQSKGNYVASNANTSGSSGDLQISAAYYSNSSGAPYLSGYNASGTLTSYILATQDWTNGRFATLDNLSSTNNTLNENTQNLNSALNSTNTQVSNLNDLKISTSTNTSGSGNTKVDSIYYSGASGKLTIVYYDSSGNQVTKFLTVTS